MDDIKAFLHAIRAGWRMWEGRLCFSEEWKEEDLKDGRSVTRRTAHILISIMNQIMPSLQFNDETSLFQQDGNMTKYETDEEEFDETSLFQQDGNMTKYETDEEEFDETDEEEFSSHQEEPQSQDDTEEPDKMTSLQEGETKTPPNPRPLKRNEKMNYNGQAEEGSR